MAAQPQSFKYPTFNLEFVSDILDNKALSARKEMILHYVQQHPLFSQMLKKILAKGNLTVNFPKGLTHPAICDIEKRMISINPTLTDHWEILWGFVFEACNLNNTQLVKNALRYHQMIHFCRNHIDGYSIFIQMFPDPIHFVKNIEHAELSTYHQTIRIMQLGCAEYNWPKPDKINQPSFNCSWDEWWRDVTYFDPNKTNGLSHAQVYILEFYDNALEIIANNKTILLHSIFEPQYKTLFLEALNKYRDLLIEENRITQEKNNMLAAPLEHAFSLLETHTPKPTVMANTTAMTALKITKDLPAKKPLTYSFNLSTGLTAIAGVAATAFLALKLLRVK